MRFGYKTVKKLTALLTENGFYQLDLSQINLFFRLILIEIVLYSIQLFNFKDT